MFQAVRSDPQMGSLAVSGKIFPLYRGVNLIGRLKTATVILKNESVSQHQAIIIIIDDRQHFLSDVFSSNGTTLEKKKLEPLKIYELKQDNVIEFANVSAVYKKVPDYTNSTSANPIHNGNLQNTQNVDESFYLADTQALDETTVPPISEAHHNGYFDDGYDFNNLPSPPNVTIISPRKTGISIHEMPTQLYDIININNIENEIEIPKSGKSSSIHDIPTQLVYDNVGVNVSTGESALQDDNVTIHVQEKALRTSSTQSSVHFEPTQILNPVEVDHLDETIVPQSQEISFYKENERSLNISEGIIDQSVINNSGIVACNSKMDVQNNSSTLIESTPNTKMSNKNNLDIGSNISNNETFIETDASQEIGQKRKICKPLQFDSEGDLEKTVRPSNDVCSDNTQSQEIGYKKKRLYQIDSDSDTDTEDYRTSKENVQTSSLELSQEIGKHNKQCRKLSSDSSNEENQQVKKCLSFNKRYENLTIDSDSETDIELENEINSKDKNNLESDSKGVDDMLSLQCTAFTNNASNHEPTSNHNEKLEAEDSEKKNKTDNTNNESGISKRYSDDEMFLIPATQCSDDDDSDDFNFMPESTGVCVSNTNINADSTQGGVLDISQRLSEIRHRNVLEQNCSEESIHFGLTDTESTEDISVKTNFPAIANNNNTLFDENVNTVEVDAEKQQNIYIEKNGDELSQQNSLKANESEITYESKNSSVKEVAHNDDNEPLLNKSIDNNVVEEPMQPPPDCIAENNEVCQNLRNKDSSIFDLATQKVDNTQTNTTKGLCCDYNVFLENTQKLTGEQNIYTISSIDKHNNENACSTSTPNMNEDDDDIYLQATQKIDSQKLNNTNEHTFLKPLPGSLIQKTTIISKSIDNDDDIFLQPTQALSFQKTDNVNLMVNDDDIFLQPTQELHVNLTNDSTLKNQCVESSYSFKSKNLVINQNIFINPHEQIFNKNTSENEDEDIFLQPTQLLNPQKVSRTSNKKDDISMQLMENQLVIEESIFLPPTQELHDIPVTSDHDPNATKINAVVPQEDVVDDIFLQPTQNVVPLKVDNSIRSSLSLLRNLPLETCKDDEEESQLEVTFASQTLKLCSQINTRPQNPLINILEQSEHEKNEMIDDILPSNNSHLECASLNCYSEMNTIPIDQVNDFQINSETSSKKQSCKEHELSNKVQNDIPKSSKLLSSKNEKDKPISSITSSNNNLNEQNITIRVKNTKHNFNTNTNGENNVDISVNEDLRGSKKNAERNRNLSKESVISILNVDKSDSSKAINKISSSISSNSAIIGDAENSINNNETSVMQGRTTRKRRNNLDCGAEKSTPQISTANDELKSTIDTKKAKSKIKFIGNENTASKSKRTRIGHDLETPKVCNNMITRKGRKLNLDQQESVTKVSKVECGTVSNKRKPQEKVTSEASVISISSTDTPDSEKVPTTNKRRRKNADEGKVGTSVRRTRKAAPVEDNGTIKSKRIQNEPVMLESPVSTSSTPERQRRFQKPKVVFTMLEDPHLESVIRRLGGTIVDTIKTCTVLVTGSLKRSQKLLSAVGEAKPICGPDWLHASKKAGVFLDPWDHLLRDKEAEAKWNFLLKESLHRSSNQKLFTNSTFHILTTNHIDVLKAAIESCGGKLVGRVPAKNADNIIVIGNPDCRTKYLKFLQQKPPMTVVAAEAIFDGVLRQELHLDDHLLS